MSMPPSWLRALKKGTAHAEVDGRLYVLLSDEEADFRVDVYEEETGILEASYAVGSEADTPRRTGKHALTYAIAQHESRGS